MLRIGLTGGIGSGKSLVAGMFQELGVPVIDTDQLSRETLAPGQPLLEQVFRDFGMDLRRSDGSLDRAMLRNRVFANDNLRQRLEAIAHPAIARAMEARIADLPAATPYVVLIIPLLVEAGWHDRVDRILLIDCPEPEQVRRIMARDGITRDEAQRIVSAQAPRSARRRIADAVIENDGRLPLSEIRRRVEALDRDFRIAA